MSAVSGRSMEEIAEGKGKKRVWHSNRAADRAVRCPRAQTQREFKAQLLAAAESQEKKSSRSPIKTTAKPAGKPAAKATPKQKRGPKQPPPAAAARRSRAKPAVAAAARKRSASPPRGGRSTRLPDFVPPSLATLHDTAPSGPQWIHEIKFDGYRIESAARSRQGQAAHAQAARLDASLRAHCRGGRRAAGARRRCSTANWSSRTTRAFPVSRCCRPI